MRATSENVWPALTGYKIYFVADLCISGFFSVVSILPSQQFFDLLIQN